MKDCAVTLLIDTCVWLDLARDYRQRPTLTALERLAVSGAVSLAVPRQVSDEFAANKARVIADSTKSLSSVLKRVKVAVEQFGGEERKAIALSELSDIDHRAATLGDAVNEAIAVIEGLLSTGTTLETTDSAVARAGHRALARRAPCHKGKNSMADSVIIELYADLISGQSGSSCSAFVTHNKHDFSNIGVNEREPHPDIAPLFADDRSTYSLSLGEVLQEIDPDGFEAAEWEAGYEQEPRRLGEILAAEELLYRQIWYNRHWNLRHKIESGEVRLVSKADLSVSPYRQDEILDTVWDKALAAAERTEREIGLEKLGPWDDFEWGMLNGKLSALRWVLGDDWDFLDT